MNQNDYLKSLRHELERLKVAGIEEILSDHREHFEHAKESGKSEEEILRKLGSPSVVAAAYHTESLVKRAHNESASLSLRFILTSLGRLLLVVPFNFVMLFVPGIVGGALLFTGWVISIAAGIVALVLLAISPVAVLAASSWWTLLGLLFSSFGTFGLAAMIALGMYFLTRYAALTVLRYLHWNLKFILTK